jgi:tetratricopeptide (TPR) repeat protein
VAVGLNHLADLYKSQGRFREAEATYQEAMERFQESLGPGHPMVEDSLDDLMEVMEMAEREKLAPLQARTPLLEDIKPGGTESGEKSAAVVAQMRWKLNAMESALGVNHPNVAALVNSIGDVHVAHGEYEAAEPLYQRALSIDENAFGPVHERVAKDLHRLAGLYRAQERWTDAEPVYARLVSVMEQVLDKEHPDLLKTLGLQAECLEKLGKKKDAKSVRERMSQIERSTKGR